MHHVLAELDIPVVAALKVSLQITKAFLVDPIDQSAWRLGIGHRRRFKHLSNSLGDPSRRVVDAAVNSGVEGRLVGRFMADSCCDLRGLAAVMRHDTIAVAGIQAGDTFDIDVQLFELSIHRWFIRKHDCDHRKPTLSHLTPRLPM